MDDEALTMNHELIMNIDDDGDDDDDDDNDE